MFEHIDPATVLLCRFIVMVIWGFALVVALVSNRSEKAPRYWLVGVVFLLLADAQHATGFFSDDMYGRRIQFVFYACLFVFTWLGFRAFVGKTMPIFRSVGLILAFALFILVSDSMTSDVILKYRFDAAINAGLGVVFCGAIVATLMTDRLARQLPMTWLAATVYALGLISMSKDFYLVIFEPLRMHGNLVLSDGRVATTLQNFVQVATSAMTTILLLKERSEQRYRIASETDGLTSVANRSAFVRDTVKQLATAGPSSTMAVIDLDHFKSVNDTYGHQAGDEVLVAFSSFMKARLPKEACFGRMGGEEFGIFLPANGTDSFEIFDALRNETEKLTIRFQGVQIAITISIGIADIETAGADFDTLTAAADRALYSAKDNGRNQVSRFSPGQHMQLALRRPGSMVSTYTSQPYQKTS